MTRKRPGPENLSHYDIPWLYEQPFVQRQEDVVYFCELAQHLEGPVLEYGCGSGRITIPLARQGSRVTAVDRSRPMLRVLSQRLNQLPASSRQRVSVLYGDMRKLRPPGQFPLVLATFNVVAHLATFREMSRWLTQVRRVLSPGGLLCFDVALPAPEEIEADPDDRVRLRPFRHPQTREWIEHDESYSYEPRTQVLVVESHSWIRGSQDVVTTRLALRQWFPKELESLLRYEGFSVELLADYTQQPAVTCRDTLVVQARLK